MKIVTSKICRPNKHSFLFAANVCVTTNVRKDEWAAEFFSFRQKP